MFRNTVLAISEICRNIFDHHWSIEMEPLLFWIINGRVWSSTAQIGL